MGNVSMSMHTDVLRCTLLIKIHWLKNVRKFRLYRGKKKTPLCTLHLLYWPPRHLFSLLCACQPSVLLRETTPPSVSALGGTLDHGACPLLLSPSGYVIQDWPKKFSFQPGGAVVLWGVTLQTRFSGSCYLEPQGSPDSFPSQGLVCQTFYAFYKQPYILLINYFVG